MTPDFTPAVATAVRDLRPDFRALSVRVHGARNMVEEPAAAAMLKAAVAGVADGPEWADAHLASWAEAYKAFGAKPNRTPCPVDRMRQPVLTPGGLTANNNVTAPTRASGCKYGIISVVPGVYQK